MRDIRIIAPAPNTIPTTTPLFIARRLLDPSQVGLSPAERQFLDLFKGHTSRKCTGSMVDDFWQRLVHRVAEEEPAVRHAAIAMSSLHWKFMTEANSFKSKLNLEKSTSFTQAQCTKALVSLRQRLAKGDAYVTNSSHREAVLVACIMFVSLSLFQGDVKAVTSHLRSGYSVLMEWQRINFDGNPSGPILARVFSDLQLHRITFSQPQQDIESAADELPLWQAITVCRPVYGYTAVSESDFSIVLGSALSANYPLGLEIRLGTSLRALNTALADLLYQNTTEMPFVMRLLNWKSEFAAFITTYRHKLSPEDRGPVILMELWTMVSDAILASLQHGLDEMSYDSSVPLFQRMNELAALYLSLTEQVSMFSSKPMLLQILYFTATKCRDWHTRRETLRLVRNSSRREGFWTSGHFAAGVSFIIHHESAGLTPNDVIPRSARVNAVHVSPLDEKKFNLWYPSYCPPGENPNGAAISQHWNKVVLVAE